MNKVICTTTINPPTVALRKFAAMEGWNLVVACDKRTPSERIYGATYLSCEEQEKLDKKLSDLIGWNCIQRRNMAFLYALKEMKADIVATIDDDNIPDDDWGKDVLIGKTVAVTEMLSESIVQDPIFLSNSGCGKWHRGFPLELVRKRKNGVKTTSVIVDIQADFWRGEPDVDAVCRMTNSAVCNFEPSRFPFACNTFSPFNSQNTFLMNYVMPHYFMHLDVGRWDDILASYHVEAMGYRPIYCKPSVIQDRNQHDLIKDFQAEVWGTENAMNIIKRLIESPKNIEKILTPRALSAFRQYQSHF